MPSTQNQELPVATLENERGNRKFVHIPMGDTATLYFPILVSERVTVLENFRIATASALDTTGSTIDVFKVANGTDATGVTVNATNRLITQITLTGTGDDVGVVSSGDPTSSSTVASYANVVESGYTVYVKVVWANFTTADTQPLYVQWHERNFAI